MALRPQPTLFFRPCGPPGARNRLSPSIQLHANHSAVLWAPLTNTSVPCPQRAQRFLPTDLVFVGVFPNLQDLKLSCSSLKDERESTADATLTPPSIPPLQGWLILTFFTRENLVKVMIVLFGGLRFRSMDLFGVKCVRLLLAACTETLETLRLYPSDQYGGWSPEKIEENRTQVNDS